MLFSDTLLKRNQMGYLQKKSSKDGAATMLTSKALQVNLRRTERNFSIDAKYLPLQEVLEDLPGLTKQVQTILYELNHPFKNWEYVVQELRTYALRHFPVYRAHPKAVQAVEIIFNEWTDSLSLCSRPSVHAKAIDNSMQLAEKIIADEKDRLENYRAIMSAFFSRLASLPDEQFFLVASGYYQPKRIGILARALGSHQFDHRAFNSLFQRATETSYDYWLKQEDPALWFTPNLSSNCLGDANGSLFLNICRSDLCGWKTRLDLIKRDQLQLKQIQNDSPEAELKTLSGLPGYMDIVRSYEELPERLQTAAEGRQECLGNVLHCHIKIIQTKGLASLHKETIGKLTRCFSNLIREKSVENVDELLVEVFDALKRCLKKHPEAALQALENIAQGVFQKGDSDLVDVFVRRTIDMGFQTPEIKGTTTEWKVEVNPAHLANIKAWLHIIENDPKWSKKIISALIINIKCAGLCIKDTDLFQKELSLFLNSDIAPVYNLAKQLARSFPVYFNEINAEGELRDVSTELDELTGRRDRLIHFLRKQSHVESNNLLIRFAEQIVTFWKTGNKDGLSHFVPASILEPIGTQGPHFDGVHAVTKILFERAGVSTPAQLSKIDIAELSSYLADTPAAIEPEKSIESWESDKKRVLLLVRFLKLLEQKYSLNHFELDALLGDAEAKGFPGTDKIREALSAPGVQTKLSGILTYLRTLKNIILSPEQFQISEDIFHKRHIAADIPSMYGTYHERKFDALGFTFRLETLANVLFEELIASINVNFLTRTTFFEISECMRLLVEAMELDGIVVKSLRGCLDLLIHALEVRGFSFTQYLDVFRKFSHAEQQILAAHYTKLHNDNLALIIRQLGTQKLLPKYHVDSTQEVTRETINKVSEAFFRDIISTTFGFQYLDNFVSKIIATLAYQSDKLSRPDLDLLLSYDPERSLSGIHSPLSSVENPICLGNKGYNLVRLAAQKIPLPAGFIVTTEVFRSLSAITAFRKAEENLREKTFSYIRQLERATNRRLGDPANPLLLSVRSGATISMPGMMSTFLNVGLNQNIVEGLAHATKNPWFAWDNYRRFLQSWGMAHNMERNLFDAIMNRHKKNYGVERKRKFTPEQMKELALAYRQTVMDASIALTDDPQEQLFQSIRKVFYSWQSDTAKAYRDLMGISDDWGTAVIVQSMVYGNLSGEAGSGVVFTHNPQDAVDKVALWGDYTRGGQGEDVVAGLVRTESISLEQKTAAGRDNDEALEEAFPKIFEALRNIAKHLIYELGWSAQEMEFTFEGPSSDKLYLLQTRDMVVTRRKHYPYFSPSPELKKAILTKGIGVSGGALSGKAVFTLEDIRLFRSLNHDTPLILIRADTVPDDIREISAADGLLTSRGGATSHASVVAHQLDKCCVVGCSQLTVYETEGYSIIDGYRIDRGCFLSIDGKTGFVYKGQQKIL